MKKMDKMDKMLKMKCVGLNFQDFLLTHITYHLVIINCNLNIVSNQGEIGTFNIHYTKRE